MRLLPLLLLTGCASMLAQPKTVIANESVVAIRYHPLNGQSVVGATKMAETECQKYGKHARLNRDDAANQSRLATFDCVP